jgi:hypothetical protein
MTWKDVLEELRRSNGQITDYGPRVGQILFDPAVGSSGPSQRVDPEIFSLLCERGWVTTDDADQGVVRRYVISETGVARLLTRTA